MAARSGWRSHVYRELHRTLGSAHSLLRSSPLGIHAGILSLRHTRTCSVVVLPAKNPWSSQIQQSLTPRSSRAPTAGHQAPATSTLYIFCGRGLASHRRCRLTSNVRQHKNSRWCASTVSGAERQIHPTAKDKNSLTSVGAGVSAGQSKLTRTPTEAARGRFGMLQASMLALG